MFASLNITQIARRITAFLVGFLLYFFVARFSSTELALGVVGLYVLVMRFRQGAWLTELPKSSVAKRMFILLAVALVGYMATDLYVGSSFNDLAAGWGRVVFLGLNYFGLLCLVGVDWSNIRLIALGQAVGTCVAVYTVLEEPSDYWKFGFATPLTLLLLVLIDRAPRLLGSLLVLAMGITHLVLGYRSLGGVCIVTAAILIVPKMSVRWRKTSFIVALALAAGILAYVYQAAGYTGDENRSK